MNVHEMNQFFVIELGLGGCDWTYILLANTKRYWKAFSMRIHHINQCVDTPLILDVVGMGSPYGR